MSDFYGAALCHKIFERFPGLRMASVENGAVWIPDLLHRLDDAANRNPGYFADHPRDVFGEHVWVTPFWEDDVAELLGRRARGPVAAGLGLAARRGDPPADRVRDRDPRRTARRRRRLHLPHKRGCATGTRRGLMASPGTPIAESGGAPPTLRDVPRNRQGRTDQGPPAPGGEARVRTPGIPRRPRVGHRGQGQDLPRDLLPLLQFQGGDLPGAGGGARGRD